MIANGPLARIPLHILPLQGIPLCQSHFVTYGNSLVESVLQDTADVGSKFRCHEGNLPISRVIAAPERSTCDGDALPALHFESVEATLIQERLAQKSLCLSLLGPCVCYDMVCGLNDALSQVCAGDENEVLHIAAHFVIDRIEPSNSKLCLSFGDTLPVRWLHHACTHLTKLCFVAACSSGCPVDFAVPNLTASIFAFMGAAEVVTSSWDVSDAAAVVFSDLFYEAYAENMLAVDALHAAQCRLMTWCPNDFINKAEELLRKCQTARSDDHWQDLNEVSRGLQVAKEQNWDNDSCRGADVEELSNLMQKFCLDECNEHALDYGAGNHLCPPFWWAAYRVCSNPFRIPQLYDRETFRQNTADDFSIGLPPEFDRKVFEPLSGVPILRDAIWCPVSMCVVSRFLVVAEGPTASGVHSVKIFDSDTLNCLKTKQVPDLSIINLAALNDKIFLLCENCLKVMRFPSLEPLWSISDARVELATLVCAAWDQQQSELAVIGCYCVQGEKVDKSVLVAFDGLGHEVTGSHCGLHSLNSNATLRVNTMILYWSPARTRFVLVMHSSENIEETSSKQGVSSVDLSTGEVLGRLEEPKSTQIGDVMLALLDTVTEEMLLCVDFYLVRFDVTGNVLQCFRTLLECRSLCATGSLDVVICSRRWLYKVSKAEMDACKSFQYKALDHDFILVAPPRLRRREIDDVYAGVPIAFLEAAEDGLEFLSGSDDNDQDSDLSMGAGEDVGVDQSGNGC